MQSHFSKSVVPYRDKDFYPLARLAIARLVGAVPSVASARPNQCSVAILSMSHRLRGACQGCNAERREANASPRGLRAPAAPAPPFFGSPKKGGKESSPLANVPRAFARDALRPPSAPARPRA